MIGKDVDGGFAEYVKVPESSILALPEAIPFEQGAILGCAVSTAYHALRRGRAGPGDTVVVCGVGGLGIHAVQMATRVFGAENVIAVDILEDKLTLAKSQGATQVVNASKEDPAEAISRTTQRRGADVVVDFVGRKRTLEKSIACAGRGGRVVVVGISSEELAISPYSTIIGKELEILGVDDHLRSELNQLIELTSSRKIDLSHSVTHRLALENVNEGFGSLHDNTGRTVRVVIEP
jgi:2-desacetyl-2-hydroxyethyl bacteriochlorophyllide A dehydrogenase